MKTLKINPLAIVVCVVSCQIIPAAWYGLFAQQWMTLTGMTEAQANAAGMMPYLISMIGAALMTTFTAFIFRALKIESAAQGAMLGAGIGFFYSFMDMATINSFELRPFGLSLLDGGHLVVVYAVVGSILGGWRKYTPASVPEKSQVAY